MTKTITLGTTTGQVEVQPRDDETIQIVEAPEQIVFTGFYVTDENGVTVPPPVQAFVTSGSSSLPAADPHAKLRSEFAAWESASDEDLQNFDESLD